MNCKLCESPKQVEVVPCCLSHICEKCIKLTIKNSTAMFVKCPNGEECKEVWDNFTIRQLVSKHWYEKSYFVKERLFQQELTWMPETMNLIKEKKLLQTIKQEHKDNKAVTMQRKITLNEECFQLESQINAAKTDKKTNRKMMKALMERKNNIKQDISAIENEPREIKKLERAFQNKLTSSHEIKCETCQCYQPCAKEDCRGYLLVSREGIQEKCHICGEDEYKEAPVTHYATNSYFIIEWNRTYPEFMLRWCTEYDSNGLYLQLDKFVRYNSKMSPLFLTHLERVVFSFPPTCSGGPYSNFSRGVLNRNLRVEYLTNEISKDAFCKKIARTTKEQEYYFMISELNHVGKLFLIKWLTELNMLDYQMTVSQFLELDLTNYIELFRNFFHAEMNKICEVFGKKKPEDEIIKSLYLY